MTGQISSGRTSTDHGGEQVDDSRLFRVLVQSVTDYAIFRLSPEGIIRTWNAGAARLKGYTSDEIIGSSFERFYTPEDRADGKPRRLLNIARTEGRVEDEGWRVRKDGTRFWADVVITALFEKGELIGYAKVTRDLTERRRTEEQRSLRMAAERVAERVGRLQTVTAALAAASRPEQVAELLTTVGVTALGAAAGSVAFPSPEHDQLLVISVNGFGPAALEVNQRIRRDDAYAMAEAWRLGKPVFIASRANLTSSHARLSRLASRSMFEAWAAVPLVIERQLVGIMTLTYMEPHVFDDEERNVILAMADVAAQAIDRAQLFETERRTRAEAEAAVHAQDEFLSIASHELRTPVAAVKATAQLTQRSIQRGTLDAERLQRHLEGILRATDRLSSLVDDLLDVSRLRTGRLELRRQSVEIVALIQEVLDRYRMQLEEQTQFTLSLNAPSESVIVDVDPTRLEQVLDNFLSNAVKYSPDGGEIAVAVDADESGVTVTVTDQGIGLPPGQTEAIFEPFGRAPNAAAQQIPGLGLGLAICRELIEAHGGKVWASSPGERRGTSVAMWLPRHEADRAVLEKS